MRKRLRRKFSILTLLFLLLIFSFPLPVFAQTRVDFSSMKDFFKDAKMGDKLAGDIADNSIPDPYNEGRGRLLGYKLVLPKDVDPKNVNVKVKSCQILIASLCMGDSFSERVYVFDAKYNPLADSFDKTVDFSRFKMPDDRVFYILVGSADKVSSSGKFVFSVGLK